MINSYSNKWLIILLFFFIWQANVLASPIKPYLKDSNYPKKLKLDRHHFVKSSIENDTLYTIQGEMLLGEISYERNRIKLLDSNGEISTFRSDQVHKIHFANGKQRQFSELYTDKSVLFENRWLDDVTIPKDTLYTIDGKRLRGQVSIVDEKLKVITKSNGYFHEFYIDDVHKVHYANGTRKLYYPLNDDVKPIKEEKSPTTLETGFKVILGMVGLLVLTVLGVILFLLFVFGN